MSAKRNSAFRKLKSPTMRKAPKPPGRRSVSKTPPPREPTYADLLAIVQLIESGSRFSDFRLRSGDIEVEVHRGNGSASGDRHDSGPASNDASAAGPDARARPAPAKAGSPAPAAIPAGAHVIRSPMVGTFYRAPEPGAPPFVEVGARVQPDTIVCIIEVMKLMNSVPAGVAGVITDVLAENAHMVEYGQPLIAIKPK